MLNLSLIISFSIRKPSPLKCFQNTCCELYSAQNYLLENVLFKFNAYDDVYYDIKFFLKF